MHMFARYGVIIAFSLYWSSAFIAGKVALADFSPMTLLWVRFAVSAALLLPFCGFLGVAGNAAAGTEMNRGAGERTEQANTNGSVHTRGRIAKAGLLLGVFNNVFYLGLTFSALQFISPGWVVIITACSPFMTGGLSALCKIERFDKRTFLGMFAGFLGVLVMTGVNGLADGAGQGILLALLGTLAFSAGTVFFRGRSEGMPLRTLNFWQSVSGAALLLPLGMFMEGLPAHVGAAAWAALFWLVGITIFGNALWFALIRNWGAATASSFHLLNPVSGLVLSFLVLGIGAGYGDFAGAALIIAGLLVTTAKKK